MGTSSVNLPEELIELILSKCPLKSVVRLKSVSKSWRSIIFHPRFSRIHHIRRSKLPENQNKLFIWAIPEDGYSNRLYMIGFEDGKVQTESWSIDAPEDFILPMSSCDALILLGNSVGRECDYVLWDPFIREHIIISPKKSKSHIPWITDHLYYDSVSEDYKIVFVYKDWYAVYSCRNARLGEKQDFPCDRRRLVFSASVDGCMYGKQRDGGILSIMCFDVREGKVHEFPRPEGAECLDQVQLCVVSGRLCLYGFTEDGGGLQLWVMERNNDHNGCRSWRKLISMEEQGILSSLPYHTCPICLSNEGDVVLWSDDGHFIYDSHKKSLQKINCTWKISNNYFPY